MSILVISLVLALVVFGMFLTWASEHDNWIVVVAGVLTLITLLPVLVVAALWIFGVAFAVTAYAGLERLFAHTCKDRAGAVAKSVIILSALVWVVVGSFALGS